MIRNRTKIFAEMNDPNTCVSNDTLSLGKLIIGAGNNTLKILNTSQQGLLITTANGNAQFLLVPIGDAGKNKLLGVNNNGQLTWVNKEA